LSFLQIPVALASAQPERRVKPAIDQLNLANYFDAVVTAEDNGSPEVGWWCIWRKFRC
jgi:beta-phosphoglucomutase-like phosphatase (HAD superfamily)